MSRGITVVLVIPPLLAYLVLLKPASDEDPHVLNKRPISLNSKDISKSISQPNH